VIRQKKASIVQVAVSRALIVLTAWLSLVPVLHGDDRACNPAIVVHDSSQHRITAAGVAVDSAAADDHCLACHLFRSSRSAVTWKFVPQGLDDHSLVVTVAGAPIVTRSAVPIPARAPPFQL
jgi:hypothetical protein